MQDAGGVVASAELAAARRIVHAVGPCSPRADDGVLDTDKQFTGQRLSRDTGLYFYNTRYFDASIGRFISPDTVVPDASTPQHLNRYSYAGNNPLTYNDPDGHCPFCILGAIWAAYEIGSAIYDAYTTAGTLLDPSASALEKGVTAGLFVVGAVAPGGGYSTAGKKAVQEGAKGAAKALPTQTHHLASNVNKKRTKQFEKITSKYGLDLDGEWNKVKLPEEIHHTRHTDKYHEWVLENLRDIDRAAGGDKETFLRLWDERVVQKVLSDPGMVQMK